MSSNFIQAIVGTGRGPRTWENVFLATYVLALIWALDPLELGLENAGGLKHVPAVVFVGALGMWALGFLIRPGAGRMGRKSKRLIFSVVCFSLFVLVGSLYARIFSHVETTFLNLGLFPLVGIAYAQLVRCCRSPVRFVRKMISAQFVVAILMVLGVVVGLISAEELHNHEHLIIPFLAFPMFASRRIPVIMLSSACILALGILLAKNTAYLTAGITVALGYFSWIYGRLAFAGRGNRRVVLVLYCAAVITVVAMAALAYLAYRPDSAPTGNAEYRMHMYILALSKFMASPIYGDAFSSSSTIEFDLYTVNATTQTLPTHSDILDILAAGGIIGMGTFLLCQFQVLNMILRGMLVGKQNRSRVASIMGLGLAVMISALTVCAFNPVLNIPNSAMVLWSFLGACCALSVAPESEGDRIWNGRPNRRGLVI